MRRLFRWADCYDKREKCNIIRSIDGAFGWSISSLSVIPGREPRIHATATRGRGVDARLKAEHDGGWVADGACTAMGGAGDAPFFIGWNGIGGSKKLPLTLALSP
ncbi:hypothetical protein B5K08_04775 [Rhizobium leguminosarum bv. trifolii]|uniref:Uncharacterized protein n=1 Tax=Rhizobium leguminosarum bv. trifolii TaxID=386 RepID=A0A3E1BXC8_RHILT|nr:hypothetical protein B5K08_04775 [Rhizobium leguminosarum bv. trifolii]RFB99826.1 hypothetical protein B5K10_04770 [Rhizobium leguminosarum bv. trifolii]